MLGFKTSRFFIAGAIFCFFAFLANLDAGKKLTSPATKSILLCDRRLEVSASTWDCDTGIFAGTIFVRSISPKPEKITVSILKNSGLVYRKTVTVNAGKTLRFPVVMPVFALDWRHLSVELSDSYGERVTWTSFNRSYHSTTDIPIAMPRKLDQLGNTYLDYLSISTLRLERGQWGEIPLEKKEAILDWIAIGGFLENTESSDEKNELRKKFPPMNFSSKRQNGYGKGQIVEKKIFANDYGVGSIIGNSSEFDPSPSWDVKLISPGLFIPAIIIFALIIGPGAIIYSRRKKNPALVLALIPAISIVSCVIILFLSIINDGMTPKVCRQTVTFLDQIRGKALTQQIIGLEAPLGLSSPVEFPEDSIVLVSSKLSNSGGGYCIAENGMVKLHSFVQARIPAFFGMCRMEKRRERLEIKEENGGIRVMNGLGCGIEELIIRDSKGTFWVIKDIIPPGKEVSRTVSPALNITQYADYQARSILASELKSPGELDNGCYQAKLTKNVFGVDGIDSDRNVGDFYHLVVGRYRKAND